MTGLSRYYDRLWGHGSDMGPEGRADAGRAR